MFKSTSKELVQIDTQLEPILARAESHSADAEQLALDATRLLSCTSDRLVEYQDKGFFKRCWCSLSGKTGSLERANQADLIRMQKASWRYISILQERDLMLAHSIITVKNNLLTLAIQDEETRQAVTEMANRIFDRFTAVEDRVGKLEVATNIHSWLLTVDTCDYDEKYPPRIRLLRIVRDFYEIKASNWNLQELKYLQKAVSEVGLDAKKKITIQTFTEELIEEIDQVQFGQYKRLIGLFHGDHKQSIPSKFILENIAVPSYAALHRLSENYSGSSDTIEALADELKISTKDALKKVMVSFVCREGIDTGVSVPLRDLAIELLTCMGLTAALFNESQFPANKQKTKVIGKVPAIVPVGSPSHTKGKKKGKRNHSEKLPVTVVNMLEELEDELAEAIWFDGDLDKINELDGEEFMTWGAEFSVVTAMSKGAALIKDTEEMFLEQCVHKFAKQHGGATIEDLLEGVCPRGWLTEALQGNLLEMKQATSDYQKSMKTFFRTIKQVQNQSFITDIVQGIFGDGGKIDGSVADNSDAIDTFAEALKKFCCDVKKCIEAKWHDEVCPAVNEID